MKNLKEKVIIITGAGGAIAGYVAEAFAAKGASLVLIDSDIIKIQGLASSIDALHLAADLNTPEGAQTMVAAAKEHYNRIDGLIHMVGKHAIINAQENTPQLYDEIFDSNMRTLFHATQAVIPELIERKQGFIAGIASKDAWHGFSSSKASLDAAAKSAVATYLHSLEKELGNENIGVSIIYPMGLVDTPENRRKIPRAKLPKLIDAHRIADILIMATQFGPGGRLVELPVYPSGPGSKEEANPEL